MIRLGNCLELVTGEFYEFITNFPCLSRGKKSWRIAGEEKMEKEAERERYTELIIARDCGSKDSANGR